MGASGRPLHQRNFVVREAVQGIHQRVNCTVYSFDAPGDGEPLVFSQRLGDESFPYAPTIAPAFSRSVSRRKMRCKIAIAVA